MFQDGCGSRSKFSSAARLAKVATRLHCARYPHFGDGEHTNDTTHSGCLSRNHRTQRPQPDRPTSPLGAHTFQRQFSLASRPPGNFHRVATPTPRQQPLPPDSCRWLLLPSRLSMLQLGGAKSSMSFSSRAAAGGVAKAGLLLGVTGVMFRQVPQPNTLATLANASMLDVSAISAQSMLQVSSQLPE